MLLRKDHTLLYDWERRESLPSFIADLPAHMTGKPLHVPLGWHILDGDPLRRNPGSQLNSMLLGKSVDSPEKEPFIGTDKGPQSTAAKSTKME